MAKKKSRKATKKVAVKKSTKKKQKSEKKNGITELLNDLWQAAVSFRGSIEPSDYKRYVLPIIFLRFLSLKFERRREELETLIKEPGNEYYTTNKKVIASTLDDPDEYRSANVFIVPDKARWSHILKHAGDDDIKIQLDDALELLEETYPEKLRGLLPRIYAGSNMDRENLTQVINLFSKDVFKQDHGGEDLIGRVYEYFIGEFANSEGKRGGEYFTPGSIVKTLVAMLAPTQGKVFDPCCGSGGMFVQSDEFTNHNRQLSFYGQESKDFTIRLCKMNMFIHGVWGDIDLGNSYFNGQHTGERFDYIIANPPFNDGSKSENGWGANRIAKKDPRLDFAKRRTDNGEPNPMPLSARNANTMWMMHFLHHLADGGLAGFVMAAGELSNGETARKEVRQALVDLNYVDCVVHLVGQLFYGTQIPCCLWFLSKNRDGKTKGFRKRTGEVLFIDARKFGELIPGSRKQKQLSPDEIEQIASTYQNWQMKKPKLAYEDIPGFCKSAIIDDIAGHDYVLSPGRYVGTEDIEDDDEPFDEKMKRLTRKLGEQFDEAARLETEIRSNLESIGYGI